MKCILQFIVFIICANSFTKAQSDQEFFYSPVDTISRYQGIIPPVELQYDLNDIFREPFTDPLSDEFLPDDNPSTIWLKTELLLSNYQLSPDEIKFETHFTSPLYRQYIKDSEFDMVRYVLGMAQAGAVAYMAYRHIKKYGFWK